MTTPDADAHDLWLAERPDPDPAAGYEPGWDYGPRCSARGCRLHGAGECPSDPWQTTTEQRTT